MPRPMPHPLQRNKGVIPRYLLMTIGRHYAYNGYVAKPLLNPDRRVVSHTCICALNRVLYFIRAYSEIPKRCRGRRAELQKLF